MLKKVDAAHLLNLNFTFGLFSLILFYETFVIIWFRGVCMNVVKIKNKFCMSLVFVGISFISFVLLSCVSSEEKSPFYLLDPPENYSSAEINPLPGNFDQTAIDFVKNLKAGWNLGNTLDAIGGYWSPGLAMETSWGQPKASKELMVALKNSGITTVRIPVSWSRHLDDAFTIDSEWMARVKEVVDFALDAGLFVIINSHHDNEPDFYQLEEAYREQSVEFARRIWKQIALEFRNYDERLIFEFFNEPRMEGSRFEWGFDANKSIYKTAMTILQEMIQVALDEVRSSGSNNAKRFVMITAYAADIEATLSKLFQLPHDIIEDKFIISVHAYSPYSFAMQSPGERIFTKSFENELTRVFSLLETHFIKKGLPVIIGEYGATDKNNLKDRIKWFSHYCTLASNAGIPTILWDNGSLWEQGETYSENYGFFDRHNFKWFFPEILDAIIEAYK